MLKMFNIFKSGKFLYNPKFSFATKSIKTGNVQLSEESFENLTEDGKKLENTKVYSGVYPYMPLDDHPLIPGYARMLAITMDLTNKLKELNVEKTKLVISVLKNPENIEALQQSQLYIIQKIN